VSEPHWRWGYLKTTKVTPLPSPLRWRIGPVRTKQTQPTPGQRSGRAATESEITLQLTADQQVDLSISGQDAYGNPITITGDTVWMSSDESVIAVNQTSPEAATAVAVGPVGTAAVTVTNDINQDGTGDYQGSLAIDVVAGELTEIEVTAGDPYDKPA
jgi:hypothetical protein